MVMVHLPYRIPHHTRLPPFFLNLQEAEPDPSPPIYTLQNKNHISEKPKDPKSSDLLTGRAIGPTVDLNP